MIDIGDSANCGAVVAAGGCSGKVAVIASEAKQSSLRLRQIPLFCGALRAQLDCFVALLLAMTAILPASPGR
jgi:hypothetical protein